MATILYFDSLINSLITEAEQVFHTWWNGGMLWAYFEFFGLGDSII